MTASGVVAQVGVTPLPEDASWQGGEKIPSLSGLAGWDIVEASGTASAHIRLYDGTSASGILIADIALASGGASTTGPPANPVELASNAIYLQIVGTGSVEGVIYALL
jgi:hypothetical protein